MMVVQGGMLLRSPSGEQMKLTVALVVVVIWVLEQLPPEIRSRRARC